MQSTLLHSYTSAKNFETENIQLTKSKAIKSTTVGDAEKNDRFVQNHRSKLGTALSAPLVKQLDKKSKVFGAPLSASQTPPFLEQCSWSQCYHTIIRAKQTVKQAKWSFKRGKRPIKQKRCTTV